MSRQPSSHAISRLHLSWFPKAVVDFPCWNSFCLGLRNECYIADNIWDRLNIFKSIQYHHSWLWIKKNWLEKRIDSGMCCMRRDPCLFCEMNLVKLTQVALSFSQKQWLRKYIKENMLKVWYLQLQMELL